MGSPRRCLAVDWADSPGPLDAASPVGFGVLGSPPAASPGWSPVVVDWSPVPSERTPSSVGSSPKKLTGDASFSTRCPSSTRRSRYGGPGYGTPSLDVSPQDRSFLSSVSLEELPDRRAGRRAAASRSTSPGSDREDLPVAEGASWRHFDPDRERLIGVGSYAEVVKVCQPGPGRWFALKRSRAGSARARRHLRRELASFARLSEGPDGRTHPGIVRLHGAWEEAGRVCLQLELCLGSAGDLARRVGALSEDEARSFLAQVLQPLEHMHGRGLSHLDLKPENILFKLQGWNASADDPLPGDARWGQLLPRGRFKLADLSLMAGPESADGALDWGSSTVAAGCFIPVELHRAAGPRGTRSSAKNIDTRACDVYGAGACTFFMARVKAPVRDDVTDEVLDLDAMEVGAAFRELLRDLLSPSPAARGSARDARERVRALGGSAESWAWDGAPEAPPSPTATPPPARSPSPVHEGAITPKRPHFPRSANDLLFH